MVKAKNHTKSKNYWDGVLMNTLEATADPDSPLRSVTLPVEWDIVAASALAQIVPGDAAIDFSSLTAEWLPILAPDDQTARALVWLLLTRQASPTEAVWHGLFDRPAGFIINLGAFVSPDSCFEARSFVAALRLISTVLRHTAQTTAELRNEELPLPDLFDSISQSTPQKDISPFSSAPFSPAGKILLTNLDVCLSGVGLDYDSEDGRHAACAITALATITAHLGCELETLPIPPTHNVLPGLGEALRDVWNEAAIAVEKPLPLIETGFSTPNPIDGLLGVETCGFAPTFSLLRPDGSLATSTRKRLEFRGFTLETALAAALAGESVLPRPSPKAHLAMHHALTSFVDFMPAKPEITLSCPDTYLARGQRHFLPTRHSGLTQKTTIGGHSLFMRTSDYEDGSLGELSLTPTRASTMVRGLMESFGEAVSIGLQYGVPLEAFVDHFAYSCFGVAGTVEGDPVASYATSMLDYVFRTLSNTYLGRRLPDSARQDNLQDQDPLLPLDFPDSQQTNYSSSTRRNRFLRLVSSLQ
ncbi:MAG: vitamin B12-dependent ribonucleotide reductase [Acetobacter sp.]|nr:vitamin B12-dependent ribonucleotide reductase [Acetobacter sp.]